MSVTVHDVARRANVSISTVSRVLNGSAPVSAEKRKRVVEAVEELGFTPNPVARSLLKRKTGTIGAVLPYITGEFFAELLCGLDEGAQVHEQVLLVSASHRHEPEFRAALQNLVPRVDGIVVMAPELDAKQVLAITGERLPVVFLNTNVDSENVSAVNFDNCGGMRELTSSLRSTGRDRIAFVKGPEDAHDAQDRLCGFRDGLGDSVQYQEYEGDFSAECGYEAAMKVLHTTPRPNAIMAANDLSALGALRALLECGVRVPDDMALTGFDDIPSARFATPSLTSVNVPIHALAAQAVDKLMATLQGTATNYHVHLEPLSIHARESTAASLRRYVESDEVGLENLFINS